MPMRQPVITTEAGAGWGEAVPARIGPNAVIQLLPALRAAAGETDAAALFHRAGAAEWFAAPPGEMVEAARVARLHQTLRATLPPDQARTILREAGRLTAEYLLAHRIPRPVQAVLKMLPPPLAARLLVPAIRAHAWTFAGSGQVRASAGAPVWFEIAGNPLCAGETVPAPVCVWHEAVFTGLFSALVSVSALTVETHCAACGDAYCRFAIDWRR